MFTKNNSIFALVLVLLVGAMAAEADVVEISSVRELAEYAAKSGNTVRMKAGVYRLADYLTDEQIAEVRKELPGGKGRPPVWMLRFSGNDNQFDLRGVELEISTELYPKFP